MTPRLSRRTVILTATGFACATVLPWHGAHAQAAAAGRPLSVVASVSFLADMVREIGGDAVSVSALVGPNADAHVYQPTPADGRRLAEADVIVLNGLGFEGWMPRLVRASRPKGATITASSGIRTLKSDDDHAGQGHGHGHGHAHGAADPHIWQDPRRAQVMVRTIAEGLAKASPTHADAIRARAADYVQRLQELESWAVARLAPIPQDQRRVMTSHDSFAYLGERFGITFLSPQGVSTEAEPSARELTRLIEQLRTGRVRALFAENVTNTRLLQQISEEAGVSIGGRLYSDALSAPDGPAPTYIALLRHNIETIASAMEAAPSRR